MISIKKILSSNINSKNFTYFTDLCKSYGLTDGVVRNRIARGWTIEQAFGIVFRKSESPGRDKKVEVDGI